MKASDVKVGGRSLQSRYLLDIETADYLTYDSEKIGGDHKTLGMLMNGK